MKKDKKSGCHYFSFNLIHVWKTEKDPLLDEEFRNRFPHVDWLKVLNANEIYLGQHEITNNEQKKIYHSWIELSDYVIDLAAEPNTLIEIKKEYYRHFKIPHPPGQPNIKNKIRFSVSH